MQTNFGVVWCHKQGDLDTIYIFRDRLEKEIEIKLSTFSRSDYTKENGNYFLNRELVLIQQLKESKGK